MRFRPSTSLALAVLIGGLALAGQWAAHIVASRVLHQTIQEREVDKANSIGRVFSGLLDLHADRARLAARLIAARTSTGVALGREGQARRDALAARLQEDFAAAEVSTLEVVNEQEVVVYRAQEPLRFDDRADGWGIGEALAGSSQIVSARHGGQAVVRAVEPVRRDGAVVGAVVVGINLDHERMRLMSQQLGAELVLLSRDGKVRAGAIALLAEPDASAMTEAFEKKVPIHRLDELTRHTSVYLPVTVIDDGYVMLARIDSGPAYQLAESGRRQSIVFAAFTLLLSVALGLWVLRRTLAPLRRLRSQAERIALDLTGSAIQSDSRDEIKSVVQVLNTLTDSLMLRNSELLAAKTAADAASLAKSRFLSAMSHEIRTPLNGVLGVTELLARTPLSATQAAHVQAIHSAGRMLHSLLSDVLDLAKIEEGQVQLECLDFDPDGLLRDVASVYRDLASGRGLTLQLEPPEANEHWVRGDPTRVRQVLTNLLGNALKFTQRGRIVLSCQQLPPRVGDTRSWWRFAVADSGVGIADDAKEKLFKRFAQADASTTRRFGGTGLGLAICKELVQMMGGRISFESRLGEGSCFWMELPFDAAAAARPEAPPATQSVTCVKARVLVAEDNAINQRVIRGLLESLGADVVVVDDGQQAVQMVQGGGFDLVFMDCQMPEMDGFDATRHIRAWEQQQGLPAMPIVALTANALSGDREACLAAGMSGYLSKPITFAALTEALAQQLPHAAVLREQRPQGAPPLTSAPSGSSTLTPQSESQPCIYDPQVLAELPMVKDGSDPDFAPQMLQSFCRATPGMLDRIEEGLRSPTPEAALRHTHNLKSSAAQVGALAMSAEAQRLETALRLGQAAPSGAVQRLRQHLAAFEVACSAHAGLAPLT